MGAARVTEFVHGDGRTPEPIGNDLDGVTPSSPNAGRWSYWRATFRDDLWEDPTDAAIAEAEAERVNHPQDTGTGAGHVFGRDLTLDQHLVAAKFK